MFYKDIIRGLIEENLREVICNLLILNSPLRPLFLNLYFINLTN